MFLYEWQQGCCSSPCRPFVINALPNDGFPAQRLTSSNGTRFLISYLVSVTSTPLESIASIRQNCITISPLRNLTYSLLGVPGNSRTTESPILPAILNGIAGAACIMNATWLEYNSAGLAWDLTSMATLRAKEYSAGATSVASAPSAFFVGFGTPP